MLCGALPGRRYGGRLVMHRSQTVRASSRRLLWFSYFAFSNPISLIALSPFSQKPNLNRTLIAGESQSGLISEIFQDLVGQFGTPIFHGDCIAIRMIGPGKIWHRLFRKLCIYFSLINETNP
jgi:hypothetical protein